ncbi:hypothetical protein D3C86_1874430 [compost metagenome]
MIAHEEVLAAGFDVLQAARPHPDAGAGQGRAAEDLGQPEGAGRREAHRQQEKRAHHDEVEDPDDPAVEGEQGVEQSHPRSLSMPTIAAGAR